MLEIPLGTVTFLFTDIESSTRLWEEYPEAMQTALALHDQVVRDAMIVHQGYIFKRLGDAFCVAFDFPAEALSAAIEAQIALNSIAWPATGPLRTRIAIHTGAAQERDGDYFGTPLNRLARLRAAAHGGQILVSQATAELVRGDLPDSLQLTDLGIHRLKDLQDPERIFQLAHPDIASEFPPLRSLDEMPNNLPHQLTAFIGREQETEDLRRLVRSTRLVTLIGMGGCGKTRIAVQVAADLLEEFPDGVFLVDLATISDPVLIPQVTASALEISEEPGRALRDTLTHFLQARSILLLMDNCEHMTQAVAVFVQHLLQACPKLRVLATGREALGIPGETVWRVPPMLLPDTDTMPSLEELGRYEAIRLFVERVAAIQPAFVLSEQNAPFVLQICRQLDGLPLAIELAAARARVLSLEQLSARIDDRFRLLTGGSRTALPRQQTLRALIDWSYDLLSEPEKRLFRRLSVFSGGWTLEAAEIICSDSQIATASQDRDAVQIDPLDVLNLLIALVDKSLVIGEERGSTLRYRLLDTIRQYCRERLQDVGETEAMLTKHRDYFLDLAEQAYTPLAAGDRGWMARIAAEHDNFRAALFRCSEAAAGAETGLKMAGALLWFWFGRGDYTEGREHLERALQCGTNAPPLMRARALNGAGAMAHGMGDFPCAIAYHTQAMTIFRELGEKREVAFSMAGLGAQYVCLCQFEEAKATLEEGLTLAREINDRWCMGLLLLNLAEATWHLGEKERAEALCGECLIIGKETNNALWMAYAFNGLGAGAIHHGNYAHARELYANALALFREVGDRRNMAYSIEGFALIAAAEQQYAQAARLFGATEALRETIRSPWTPPDHREYDPIFERLRQSLGEEQFVQSWAQGRTLNSEQAISLALGSA